MRLSGATQGRPHLSAAHRVVVALTLTALAAGGSAAQRPVLEKASLQIGQDRSAYEPGSTARLAAMVTVDSGWHVQSNTPSFEYLIPTELSLTLPSGWSEIATEYPAHTLWMAEFEDQPLAVYQDTFRILVSIEIPASAALGSVPISAVLRYQACDDRQCLPPTDAYADIELMVGDGGAAVNAALFDGRTAGSPEASAARPAVNGGAAGDKAPPPIAAMLLLGLLGGLILNAMPCVLPVLSLKIFGLLETAGRSRRATTVGALATAAGIVVSFWTLALAAILARNAGQLIGWGVQFQNPAFVTFLVLVVVLFCLNLWGLFEIPLPRRLATLAAGGDHEGVAGHFGTGLFATLMATPCSAPFLGTAVGFALSQTGAMILAVFTAVGIGMALPYLLIAAAPRSIEWMPKPGEWMLRLKVVMGFLLAGAAVWLLYVLAAQVSPESLAFIEVGLLVLALFVWMSRQGEVGSLGRRVATIGTIAAIVATLAISVAGGGASTVRAATAGGGLIDWTTFDRSAAEALAQEGRLVFVDVTADWCFTCKANEKLVLETEAIAAAFERHGVIAMRADWTNRNDEIASYLADFGRYSIPFYMLHRPGREPHLFGELLRKKDIISVLEASGMGERAAVD